MDQCISILGARSAARNDPDASHTVSRMVGFFRDLCRTKRQHGIRQVLVGRLEMTDGLQERGRTSMDRAKNYLALLPGICVLVALPMRGARAHDCEYLVNQPPVGDLEKSYRDKLYPILSCKAPIDDRAACNRFLGRALESIFGNTDFKAGPDDYMLANDIAMGLKGACRAGKSSARRTTRPSCSRRATGPTRATSLSPRSQVEATVMSLSYYQARWTPPPPRRVGMGFRRRIPEHSDLIILSWSISDARYRKQAGRNPRASDSTPSGRDKSLAPPNAGTQTRPHREKTRCTASPTQRLAIAVTQGSAAADGSFGPLAMCHFRVTHWPLRGLSPALPSL
jgi:hypothetical protein